MKLAVKVGDCFETLQQLALVFLDLLLLLNVQPVEGDRQEPRIILYNGFIHDRPAVGISYFTIAALLEQKAYALEVFLFVC